MKLRGKVAIVTGGGRAIGKANAIGFAKEDADVVVAARTELENEKLPGTIFLAQQDAKGVTGRVATDEELCAWHGL